MESDEDARRAGFRNAQDMSAYAEAMRDEDEIARWIEAGAPSSLLMWREIDGVERPDTVPLTVPQAAARLNLSTKSVRRRLPALAAMEPPGAYRTADNPRAPWRIIPAALDRLREVATVEPMPAPLRGRHKAPATKKRSATRWEV
jgi:hypothetical protein